MKILAIVPLVAGRLREPDRLFLRDAESIVTPVDEFTIAVIGAAATAEAKSIVGSATVLLAAAGRELVENDPRILAAIAETKPDAIVIPASDRARQVLPGIAHALGLRLVLGVGSIARVGDELTARRHWARGTAAATIAVPPRSIVTVLERFGAEEGRPGKRTTKVLSGDFDSIEAHGAPEAGQLPALRLADRVVGIGRGLGDVAQLKHVAALQDALGAGLAASRQAIEEKFASGPDKVGETGAIIAPELYIALGISGANQHMSGIVDARRILAVNSSSRAAIIPLADATVVADVREFLPALTTTLLALRSGEPVVASAPANKRR